jgi:hypothetical protein
MPGFRIGGNRVFGNGMVSEVISDEEKRQAPEQEKWPRRPGLGCAVMSFP